MQVKTTLTAREVGLFMQDCIRKYYSTSGWVVERKGTKRPRSEVVKDADHEEVNFIQTDTEKVQKTGIVEVETEEDQFRAISPVASDEPLSPKISDCFLVFAEELFHRLCRRSD
ncbi:hypothetical protein Aduo_010114 [Ancylostoma duodenale]